MLDVKSIHLKMLQLPPVSPTLCLDNANCDGWVMSAV